MSVYIYAPDNKDYDTSSISAVLKTCAWKTLTLDFINVVPLEWKQNITLHHRLIEQFPVPVFDGKVELIDNPDAPEKDDQHYYIVNGQRCPKDKCVSATTYISRFFSEFNAESIAENLSKYAKPSSKYYKLSKERILQMWDENAKLGTALHAYIEAFYESGQYVFFLHESSGQLRVGYYILWMEEKKFMYVHPRLEEEFRQFLGFHYDYVIENNLVPFRAELRIFDAELSIPGSIDMLFIKKADVPKWWKRIKRKDDSIAKGKENDKSVENGEVELIMIDWKRSSAIRKGSFQKKIGVPQMGTGPFYMYEDCNFSKYALQQNLYKLILERNTQFKIKEMFLCQIHREVSDRFILHEIKSDPKAMNLLVECRTAELDVLAMGDDFWESTFGE